MNSITSPSPTDPDRHSVRAALARERLAVLTPTQLDVIDESALHAGHEGGRGGASHLRVRIASPRFAGLSPVARHRLVYDLLRDQIPHSIHALAIEAVTTP